MAKKKKEPVERQYEITQASIQDDFCNYSYDITGGVGLGNTHTVKGKGIVDPDMHDAYSKLNVHLAALDDVFNHSGIEIDNIDKLHGHELATLYNVTGFKIKSTGDSYSIVLIGNKYLGQAAGRSKIEIPKIPLDNNSSYKWWNELKEAAEAAREQVALYHEGKYTEVEIPETDETQGSLELEPAQ